MKMRQGGLLVALLGLAGAVEANQTVYRPAPLDELVQRSPTIVLARPSKLAPRVLVHRESGHRWEHRPVPFDVVKVLRGPAIAERIIYVDPAGWQLDRQIGDRIQSGKPVPSPIVSDYRAATAPGEADDVILFLRQGLEGAYDETMHGGRESASQLEIVKGAIERNP